MTMMTMRAWARTEDRPRDLPCREQGVEMIPTTGAGTTSAIAEDQAAITCWGCSEREWCASLAVEGTGPTRTIHYGVWGGDTATRRALRHILDGDGRWGVAALVPWGWIICRTKVRGRHSEKPFRRYCEENGGSALASLRLLAEEGKIGQYTLLLDATTALRERNLPGRETPPTRLALILALHAAEYRGCDTPVADTEPAVRAALIRGQWTPPARASLGATLTSARRILAGIGQRYTADALDQAVIDVRTMLDHGYVLGPDLQPITRSRPHLSRAHAAR